MGDQKLGGAAESGGRTILRGRPSSADFLSGAGWLGLEISWCHAAACSGVLGVPKIRSVSDQPMDVHGSTSVFGEACGRALAGGARGSSRTGAPVVCDVFFWKAMKRSPASLGLSMVR